MRVLQQIIMKHAPQASSNSGELGHNVKMETHFAAANCRSGGHERRQKIFQGGNQLKLFLVSKRGQNPEL